MLVDKRLESERELARLQREIAAVEASLVSRVRPEGRWLWFLAVPVGVLGALWAVSTLLFCGHPHGSRINKAKVGAEVVMQAAELYVNVDQPDSGCPTVDEVIAAKKLDGKKADDPWGRRYSISCEAEELRVTSAGKDGHFHTPDDVRDDFKPSDIKRVAELGD